MGTTIDEDLGLDVAFRAFRRGCQEWMAYLDGLSSLSLSSVSRTEEGELRLSRSVVLFPDLSREEKAE